MKCRSAVTAHTHIPHVHLFACSKRHVAQMSGLYASEEKRNNSLWRLVGLVFCVGFNCNGRQSKVGLEMLDLLSSLNSFNLTSIHANVLTIDYICAVTSQWKAMGTTCRILTFSGKPYFFFRLSTAPESWWVAAHHKNKTALPPPCCHSPH